MSIEINNYIKDIVYKLDNGEFDDLPYTNLNYYIIRVIREIHRLESYLFAKNMPIESQRKIQEKIDLLEVTNEKLKQLLSDKKVDEKHSNYGMCFSELTNRLKKL